MSEARSELLYQRLARVIAEQIASGALREGERVPSVRAFARSAGVSITTVNQAYEQLERLGLVRSKPRSGYFVAAAAQQPVPQPSARTPRGRRPRSVAADVLDTILDSMQRSDMIGLGSAVTAFAGRLNGRLNRITREVLREQPALPNVMTVPPGNVALRRIVAQRLGLSGAVVDPDDVVITAGTMEAITLSLGILCRPGDAVLVESPTYFGVLQAIEHLGLKVVEVANRPSTGIDVDAVERLVAQGSIAAAVLMPNFNNPTGALTPDDEKERLTVVLGKAGIPIIEDDIYGDLPIGAARPRPLRAFGNRGLIITCASVSKTVALGYRIGWAVSPELAGDIARAKFCSSVACPGLQQQVLVRYFESGGYDRYLRLLRENLAVDRRRYREAIATHFPPGTRISEPAGGVVLWVELPKQIDGLTLFRRALAAGIGTSPGSIFSAKGDFRNYLRIAMGAGWNDDIVRGLRRLGTIATELLSK